MSRNPLFALMPPPRYITDIDEARQEEVEEDVGSSFKPNVDSLGTNFERGKSSNHVSASRLCPKGLRLLTHGEQHELEIATLAILSNWKESGRTEADRKTSLITFGGASTTRLSKDTVFTAATAAAEADEECLDLKMADAAATALLNMKHAVRLETCKKACSKPPELQLMRTWAPLPSSHFATGQHDPTLPIIKSPSPNEINIEESVEEERTTDDDNENWLPKVESLYPDINL